MSRATRRSRALVFALMLALVGLVGLTCDDFVVVATGTAPPVSLKIDVVTSYSVEGYHIAIAELIVTTDSPIQAVDLTLTWDAASMEFATASPHDEFDDDGVMFDSGVQAAGEIARIIDLRHGISTVQGAVRVANVVLIYIEDGNPVTVRLKGSVVGPGGNRYEVIISEHAVITPIP